MNRKILNGIVCAFTVIVLSGCSGKTDKNGDVELINKDNEETTSVLQIKSEEENVISDEKSVESTSAPQEYENRNENAVYVPIQDDEKLITYNNEVGFVNKDGKNVDVTPIVLDKTAYMFNTKMYNYNYEVEFGAAAIYVTEGEKGCELYYIDKDMTPVLLTDNLYPGSWVYYDTSYADISRDGNEVIYCTAPDDMDDMKMDLYLYDKNAGTSSFIDSDVLKAYFTIDSNYIVYLKQNEDVQANSFSLSTNGEGTLSDYVIYDIRNNKEFCRLNASQYSGEDIRGYIEVNDNGDILIFNGLNGTSYLLNNSICILKQDKILPIFNSEKSYTICTDIDADEMFVSADDVLYYLDAERAELVEIGTGFDLCGYAEAAYYKYGLLFDTLDRVVLAGADGLYVWNKDTYTAQKVADASWLNGQQMVMLLENRESILYVDKNGIYRIDNYDTQMEKIELLAADTSKLNSLTYITLDTPIYIEYSGDNSMYGINIDGSGEYILGENDVYGRSKYGYTYMKYAGRYLYDDGHSLYSVDRKFNSQEKICDLKNITVLNEPFYGLSYAIWPIYTTLDGSIYMYNGDKNIKLR